MDSDAQERWLVVGLGNPGPHYAGTRHNVGFEVADLVAKRAQRARARSGSWRRKFSADLCEADVGTRRASIVKPMTFMNESGRAIGDAARFFRVPAERVVIVHDDVDLDPGRLKLKVGGGDGGHKGVRSAVAAIGDGFARVRVGVGKRPGRDTADFVLEEFTRAEREVVDVAVVEAADAVEAILRAGAAAAMNRYNVRPVQGGDEED